jgi:catalase
MKPLVEPLIPLYRTNNFGIIKHNIMNLISSLITVTMVAGGLTSVRAQEQKSSPAELVDALHTAFGTHHSRAVHAKGIIFEGSFTPDKHAADLTSAVHLQKQPSKIIMRFSNFTGIPDIPDNTGAANPRGFAIKFIMPDGTNTDIVGHSFNGFPTSNSDEFRQLLLSIAASGPGAAKPTALDSFLDTHPIARTFLTTQHTPASYATINYFGVNSFRFTNKHKVFHYIRYQFIPDAGEQFMTPADLDKAGPDYLIKEIAERIQKGPVKFSMYAQIAEDSDIIEDPSIAWPDDRKRVLLGSIVINKLADNSPEGDKKLSFIPNNLPAGIETADPMLNFRSKAYPISVKERQ